MNKITLSSGREFLSDLATSILDGAIKSGVTLPYSCKTGRCSSCKVKVIKGQARVLREELGLSEDEKLSGWVLSCVRSADTDLTIEVEDLGGVVLPKVSTIPCRIASIEKLAPDVIRVVLRLPPTVDFEFIPGQYIDLIGDRGVRRSYSLANADLVNKKLELHIRAVDKGQMSTYWFNQAKLNDLLRLNGPQGSFFLRNVSLLDLVFLATGTGIAPIKAILESLSGYNKNARPRSVTVLWGGRTPSDLYFDMGSVSGEFKYIPVLSRADAYWEGAHGYVQNVLLSIMPNLTQAAVYACGSNVMIQDARSTLIANGLTSNRFYSDAFVCTDNFN